jgi:hypothetical protein
MSVPFDPPLTLRYVVLFHRWGADRQTRIEGQRGADDQKGKHVRGDHFDWMFEGESGLQTWSTPRALRRDVDDAIEATELPLHRTAYLDYEGPVSGDRGTVRRVEAGRFRFRHRSEDRWELDVQGDRVGRLVIRRSSTRATAVWRIEFRPHGPGEGDSPDASLLPDASL